ncbi:Tat pathway signal sequence domain protein [Planomonospora parontospora]|uniref:Tat pathway signal sequence domain protein n=1 Tax=Planomonospora parontospora TaxID=58119 RepID=UPI00166F791F|nr:Tat pathway signal sequence domain protein [Planomonospora parontospora]
MRRARIMMAFAVAGATAVVGVLSLVPGEQGSQAAQSVARPPSPGDPLTGDEITRAGQIASATWRSHMTTGRAELLYVERDDDKAAGDRRRADAYIYDYRTDRLVVRTVDLAKGEVVEERTGRGVQPPPSRGEETAAAELLLADPKYGERVRAAHLKAGGRPLVSAADLGLRALTFTPRPGDKVAGACEVHRCVRLFVRLPDGSWLDTSRIVVDLSAKKILTLEW